MENAKVVLIEDWKSYRELAEHWLTHFGHSIVEEATTLPSALEVIKKLGQGMLCDAIILDGNLGNGPSDFSDARKIHDSYKANGLSIPIIGYSVEALHENGINIPKEFETYKNGRKAAMLINSL